MSAAREVAERFLDAWRYHLPGEALHLELLMGDDDSTIGGAVGWDGAKQVWRVAVDATQGAAYVERVLWHEMGHVACGHLRKNGAAANPGELLTVGPGVTAALGTIKAATRYMEAEAEADEWADANRARWETQTWQRN